jgi:hypothetical protein
VGRRQPDEIRTWLEKNPSLDDLREEFPAEWDAVQRELVTVVERSDPAALSAYVEQLSAQGAAPSRRSRRSAMNDVDPLSAHIRRQMAVRALRKHCLAVATGVTSGKVRFNVLNGYVAQRLLFRRGLERKPVSMRWFRMLWPLLRQRDFLMPLVQPKGIYCFYSRPLIHALAAMIGPRSCLEIAAGDGTLTRFLAERGVQITATDDYSWQQRVQYPDFVLREDAREALRRRAPEVVICSWPPAGNGFERYVFMTASVQLYIVIGSRHRFASGDWAAYDGQTRFELHEDPELARLVLPPELESAVYIFRRR